MTPNRCFPDYAGASVRGIVPALLGPASVGGRAADVDAAGGRAPPSRSCCSCSTASAGSSSQDHRRADADARRHGRRPDHHGRAVDDGDRADLDHHRPHARRARPGRLPHGRRRRGAQRAALDESARRRAVGARPAARRPAVRAVPRPRGPGGHPAELPSTAFTEAHLARLARRSAGGRRRRSPVEVGASSRAASGSSTPTTTASTRSPTSAASATYYDAELRAADRLVGDVLDAAHRRRGAAGHGRPRPGRRRRPHRRARPPTSLDMVADAVGRGPVPLAARPPRRRPTSWPRRPPTRYDDVAWVVTRDQVIDERWFGPTIAAPVAARLGDVALVAVAPISFHRPRRHRPVRADLPARLADIAEMLVPLLAGRR